MGELTKKITISFSSNLPANKTCPEQRARAGSPCAPSCPSQRAVTGRGARGAGRERQVPGSRSAAGSAPAARLSSNVCWVFTVATETCAQNPFLKEGGCLQWRFLSRSLWGDGLGSLAVGYARPLGHAGGGGEGWAVRSPHGDAPEERVQVRPRQPAGWAGGWVPRAAWRAAAGEGEGPGLTPPARRLGGSRRRGHADPHPSPGGERAGLGWKPQA